MCRSDEQLDLEEVLVLEVPELLLCRAIQGLSGALAEAA